MLVPDNHCYIFNFETKNSSSSGDVPLNDTIYKFKTKRYRLPGVMLKQIIVEKNTGIVYERLMVKIYETNYPNGE